MHQTIQTLKNALGYATFTDPDIQASTLKLVDELGEDLEGDDYEQGVGVEDAEKDLTVMLDTADSATEDTDAAIKEYSLDGAADEDEEANESEAQS